MIFHLPSFASFPSQGIETIFHVILSPILWSSKLRDWGGLLYYPLLGFTGLPSRGIEMVFYILGFSSLSSREIKLIFHIILSSALLVFRSEGLRWSSILFSPWLCWSSELKDQDSLLCHFVNIPALTIFTTIGLSLSVRLGLDQFSHHPHNYEVGAGSVFFRPIYTQFSRQWDRVPLSDRDGNGVS